MSELLSPNVRVVAIDDHPMMLLGIAAASSYYEQHLQVVATAASVRDQQISQHAATVAVLDLRLDDGSKPADNIAALHRLGFKVVAHADGEPISVLDAAVSAGAAGVVPKNAPIDQLMQAIRTVASGGTWISAELAARLHKTRSNRPQLTDRELDVLGLLHDGLITKEVARRLDLQESTIKEHIKRVRHKYSALGRPASTRIELLNRVVEDGYLHPRN